MFYIHQTTCISPQSTYMDVDIETLHEFKDNVLRIIEPAYEGMPSNMLRRMSKIVRIGVGSALPLINVTSPPNGIIIGTGIGGMEESSKFLDQIIEYDEGLLTPGDFVQSTSSATAALIGMLNNNHSYNVTHVHRGLSFENAVIDAAMLLNENPSNSYLVGGADGVSSYNHHIDERGGWHKKEMVSNASLYTANSPGTISGEGSAMFLIDNNASQALARLNAVATLHHTDEGAVKTFIADFLNKNLQPGEKIDLLISGENGDSCLLKYYEACEELVEEPTAVVRFKHMCGEYPTASSFALWLATRFLSKQLTIPAHMIKRSGADTGLKNVLIYNTHKGNQHSCMLISSVD